MDESQTRRPGADPGDDERSGDNVVEGMETLAAGTRSGGVQESPEDAKPGRAPVEQVGGDEDMTEGREVSGSAEPDSGDSDSGDSEPGGANSGGTNSGGTDSGDSPGADAPMSPGVSGGAQSIAGGRVSDRVSAEGQETPDEDSLP